MEAAMAKGQKRSGREPRKPKKSTLLKLKPADVGSAFGHNPGRTTKLHSKKA
jgi:hypothetical protein